MLNCLGQFIEVERLAETAKSASIFSLTGDFIRKVSCHHDDRYIRPQGTNLIECFHSGYLWHPNIQCIKGACKDGQGKMIFPEGRIYIGEFKSGERTGYGTMIYPDGSKKTGRFSDGEYLDPKQ